MSVRCEKRTSAGRDAEHAAVRHPNLLKGDAGDPENGETSPTGMNKVVVPAVPGQVKNNDTRVGMSRVGMSRIGMSHVTIGIDL